MPPFSIPPRCGNLVKSLSGRGFLVAIDHDGQVTTQVSADLSFAARPDQVWQMLISPEYIAFKRAAQGALEFSMHSEADCTTLVFTRPISGELPAGVSALLGSSAHIVETQDWLPASADGSRAAELSIVVGQAPANIMGTASLVPAAAGTRITIELSISVSIPFFGGTAEQMIKSELEKYIESEQRLGAEWLATK